MLRGYELRHGGRLPELERAEMIREAYRSIGPLAAPLLAKWASEEPDSEIYNQTAAWAENVVAANSEVSDEASKWPGKSEDLVRFFGHGGDSESDITPRRARSAAGGGITAATATSKAVSSAWRRRRRVAHGATAARRVGDYLAIQGGPAFGSFSSYVALFRR